MAPLLFAAHGNDTPMMQVLLARGADVNLASPLFGSALVTAAHAGRKEAVRLLLDRKADHATVDRTGRTALEWAQQNKFSSVVSLLQQQWWYYAPEESAEEADGGLPVLFK